MITKQLVETIKHNGILASAGELKKLFTKAVEAEEKNIELQQKLTDMAVQLANAESKCRELAAENAALKERTVNHARAVEFWNSWADAEDKTQLVPETPATDAFLAEVRSQESAPLVLALTVIANSEQHDGETVVCDFDTLISVAAGALKDHYAAKLRKGVQS